MNRLTDHKDDNYNEPGCNECSAYCYSCCHQDNAIENCNRRRIYIKLAAYEDEEDAGLLLHLPCKINDKVYMFSYNCANGLQFNPFDNENHSSTHPTCLKCDTYPCNLHKLIRERTIKKIEISPEIHFVWSTNGYCNSFSTRDIGRTVFLTYETAEEALNLQEKAQI